MKKWFIKEQGSEEISRLSADEFKEKILDGTIHYRTQAWRKRFIEWVPAYKTRFYNTFAGRPDFINIENMDESIIEWPTTIKRISTDRFIKYFLWINISITTIIYLLFIFVINSGYEVRDHFTLIVIFFVFLSPFTILLLSVLIFDRLYNQVTVVRHLSGKFLPEPSLWPSFSDEKSNKQEG